MTEYVCPNCGASPEYTVPVWESCEDAEEEQPPDYLGCTKCRTMEAYDGDEE